MAELRYSLAEIDATSRKAARGWGFEWGIAEEIGKATRFLSSLGVPASEHLAQLLQDNHERPRVDFIPTTNASLWQASKGLLCPVLTGIALSDQSYRLLDGKPIELCQIAYPILLLYFVAQASQQTQQCFALEFDSQIFYCQGDSISVVGAFDPMQTLISRATVSISQPPSDAKLLKMQPDSCTVDLDAWEALEKFAFNIYAPSTEQSRAGAGSDTSDQEA